MMNEIVERLMPARPQRHLQGVEGEIGAKRAGGLPADDAPAEDVDHEGDVHPPGVGLHVGEIGDPEMVRSDCSMLTVDEISRTLACRVGPGGVNLLATHDAADVETAHQPLNRAAGHVNALAPQLRPHLVGAVDPAVLRPDPPHLDLELLIAARPSRRRSTPARVVRGRGDLQRATDRLDPEALSVGVEEGGHLVCRPSSSAPKTVAAALRISLARRSSRFSRSSCRIRSRSSVVSPGRWPRSISVRRSHTRRVSLFTPIFSATEMMAAHSEGYSWACSWTIRTARSRSSAGYLGDRAIAPSSQGMEPPGNPGRFTDRAVSPLTQARRVTLWQGRDRELVDLGGVTPGDRCAQESPDPG